MADFDFEQLAKDAQDRYHAPAEQVIELRRIADALEDLAKVYRRNSGLFTGAHGPAGQFGGED